MITEEQKRLLADRYGMSTEDFDKSLGDPRDKELQGGAKRSDSTKVSAKAELPTEDDEGPKTIKPKANAKVGMTRSEGDPDDFINDDGFDEKGMPEFHKPQGQVQKILTQEGYPDLQGWLDGPASVSLAASLESGFNALDNLMLVEAQRDITPKEITRIAVESIHNANGFVYSPEEGVFSKIWEGITKAISFIVEKILSVFRWIGEKLGLRSKELSNAIDRASETGGYDKDMDYSEWDPLIGGVEQEMGPDNIGKASAIGGAVKNVVGKLGSGLVALVTSDTTKGMAKAAVNKTVDGAKAVGHGAKAIAEKAHDIYDEKTDGETKRYAKNKADNDAIAKVEKLIGKIVYARQMMFSHRTLVCLGGFKRSSLASCLDDNFVRDFEISIGAYTDTAEAYGNSIETLLRKLVDIDKNNADEDGIKKEFKKAAQDDHGGTVSPIEEKGGVWEFKKLTLWEGARLDKSKSEKSSNAGGEIESQVVSFVELSKEARSELAFISGRFRRDTGVGEDLERLVKDHQLDGDYGRDNKNATFFSEETERQLGAKYGIKREHYTKKAAPPIEDLVKVLKEESVNAKGITDWCMRSLKPVENHIKKLDNVLKNHGKVISKQSLRSPSVNINANIIKHTKAMQQVLIAVLRPLGKFVAILARDATFYTSHLTKTIDAQTDAINAFSELKKYKHWAGGIKDFDRDGKRVKHRNNIDNDEGLDPDSNYAQKQDFGDDFDL